MKSGRAKAGVGPSLFPYSLPQEGSERGKKSGCVMWAYRTFEILNWSQGSRELMNTNGPCEQEEGTDVPVSVKEE